VNFTHSAESALSIFIGFYAFWRVGIVIAYLVSPCDSMASRQRRRRAHLVNRDFGVATPISQKACPTGRH
jgi:hypothetical protein